MGINGLPKYKKPELYKLCRSQRVFSSFAVSTSEHNGFSLENDIFEVGDQSFMLTSSVFVLFPIILN